MSVKINLHPYLNEGVEAQVEGTGNNVGECIMDLVKRFPAMKEKLFSKKDKLHGYVEIMVNGQSTFPQEFVYPLKDGDVVSILVFLSGG